MTEPAVEPVRLSGHDGLLSAVPVLLGFHPTDSVVYICMSGQHNRVGPVVRIDLADYLMNPKGTVEQIGDIAKKYSDKGILVFYGIAVDPWDFTSQLVEADVVVVDTVFVGNQPYSIDSQLHAEAIGKGRVVFGDREGVRARVEFDASSDDNLDQKLIAAMRNVTTRDEFLAASIDDAEPVLHQVLATCRRVDDKTSELADLCAAAAILAYRIGDGSLAQVCLDRALRADHDHRLSHLLMQAIQVGMPPSELTAILKDPQWVATDW